MSGGVLVSPAQARAPVGNRRSVGRSGARAGLGRSGARAPGGRGSVGPSVGLFLQTCLEFQTLLPHFLQQGEGGLASSEGLVFPPPFFLHFSFMQALRLSQDLLCKGGGRASS